MNVLELFRNNQRHDAVILLPLKIHVSFRLVEEYKEVQKEPSNKLRQKKRNYRRAQF